MLCGLTPSSLPCAPPGITKSSSFSLPVFSIIFSCLLPQPPFLFCMYVHSLTPLTHPIWQFFLMVAGERQMSYCKISFQDSQLHFNNKKNYWLLDTVPGSDDKVIKKRQFFPHRRSQSYAKPERCINMYLGHNGRKLYRRDIRQNYKNINDGKIQLLYRWKKSNLFPVIK